MNYPSIFNDVLGPVMRGPSSSHCAAALRIGRLCRDLVDRRFQDILIEFDPTGSLATTHKSQGSDMGLFGGFMGWEAYDERLPNYEKAIAETGWNIHIAKHDIGGGHPNTYQMTFTNPDEIRKITAISTGGGMIEIIEIDGAKVSMFGDYYETLIYTSQPEEVHHFLNSDKLGSIYLHRGDQTFVEIKSTKPIDASLLDTLNEMTAVELIRTVDPVLPISSNPNTKVPFLTSDEMIAFGEKHNLEIWELALAYESERGGLSTDEVYEKMRTLLNIMRTSVETGLGGTSYHDRILGSQSLMFRDKMQREELVKGDVLNHIILYVSAIMEAKSSMGVIVAAPTAGACGALPGAILGTVDAMDKSEDEAIKAMLAAGLIGVFIADQASFAAEVGGCQAECGSGSCMAAAGLVSLMGGTLQQSVSAASQALQNSLGMICDPIANRVEAPCLGKNVMAASNALSCANMALSNYDHLIPLDEVIQTMARVSKQMASELRCTALGGLSITPTSKRIEAQLNKGADPEQLELAEAARKFKIC